MIVIDINTIKKTSDIYIKGDSVTTRCGEVTRMLQSIQYIGSGPPTYVYSNKAVGASGEYYHVFATETRGYDGERERKERKEHLIKSEIENENQESEEFKVLDNRTQSLLDAYQKEYRKRESFLWKLQ